MKKIIIINLKFKTMLARNTKSNPFFLNLFDEIFDYPLSTIDSITKPNYNLIENDDNYEVELLLAGINKEDIDINIDNNQLVIEGERKEKNEKKYHYKELYYGKFKRTFTLPKNVNVDKINASLDNGILTVEIPKLKKEPKLSKKTIQIE